MDLQHYNMVNSTLSFRKARMDIKTFILGDYQTNSYCLTADASATDCLIIDTGLQSEPLIEYLKKN